MSPVFETIRSQISDHPVVLYMKGSPEHPQCGFSSAVVQVLNHLNVRFLGVDVLEDPELRQGIKDYTDWPTVPQLYVGGEFVGGCDIVREMYQSGELQAFFMEKGLLTQGATEQGSS